MAFNSIYDLNHQQSDPNAKLTILLEKLSEAMRALQWNAAKQHGVSPIQSQLLIFLHAHIPSLCKPAQLASEFNLTRPTISDALKSLESKKLVTRQKDPTDTRSAFIHLTADGKALAAELSAYSRPVYDLLNEVNATAENSALDQLLLLIHRMAEKGMIEPKRLCFSCSYYQGDHTSEHYCRFLKTDLKPGDLRIDCPEHQAS